MITNKEENNLLISQSIGINFGNSQAQETLTRKEIDFLVYNIPAVKKVVDGLADYVMYADLVDENLDKLEALSKVQLKEIFKEMLLYGSVGVRKLHDGSVTIVSKNRYDIILKESEEDLFVYKPELFLLNRRRTVSKKLRYFDVDKPITDNRFAIDENGNVIDVTRNWIALGNDEFVNLSVDDTVNGLSVFEYDRKRTHLMLKLLDYFIHDFERNGVGTLVFKYNENLLTRLTESTLPVTEGQIFDNSSTNKRTNIEESKRKVQQLSDELAKVQYDDSIIYSDAFSDFEQLTRDSKPSDFIEMLDDFAYKYITQLFNVNPQVFDFETAGNIGKDEVIRDFIIHRVMPMRESFAHSVNEIAKMLGLNKTYRFLEVERDDYKDYEQDKSILDVYAKLIELGKVAEAEAYLERNIGNLN